MDFRRGLSSFARAFPRRSKNQQFLYGLASDGLAAGSIPSAICRAKGCWAVALADIPSLVKIQEWQNQAQFYASPARRLVIALFLKVIVLATNDFKRGKNSPQRT